MILKEHKAVVHPKHFLKKRTGIAAFNQKFAIYISNHVGSMYCAYIFAVIGITGVTAAITKDNGVVLIVGAISGYFLQLVLLPIIMVAQNVAQEATDAKASADHQTLTYLAQIQDEQLEILKELQSKHPTGIS
jgi:hypothetical protein